MCEREAPCFASAC